MIHKVGQCYSSKNTLGLVIQITSNRDGNLTGKVIIEPHEPGLYGIGYTCSDWAPNAFNKIWHPRLNIPNSIIKSLEI